MPFTSAAQGAVSRLPPAVKHGPLPQRDTAARAVTVHSSCRPASMVARVSTKARRTASRAASGQMSGVSAHQVARQAVELMLLFQFNASAANNLPRGMQFVAEETVQFSRAGGLCLNA